MNFRLLRSASKRRLWKAWYGGKLYTVGRQREGWFATLVGSLIGTWGVGRTRAEAILDVKRNRKPGQLVVEDPEEGERE